VSSAGRKDFQGQPAVALRAPDGATAVVLLHGAQLVSWVPAGGEEQLYLSPTTRYGDGQAVRGGVPVIFPQFSGRGPLPRHGFARNRAWALAEAVVRGPHAQAVLRLAADDATRAIWPQDFEAELTISVGGRQLDIELAIANTGATPFAFTCALHTYLHAADVLKLQLEGLQGAAYEDHTQGGEAGQQWGDVLTVVGEIDRVYHGVAGALTLRDLGRRLRIESQRFDDVVVWNPGPVKCAAFSDMPAADWQRMICVEAAQAVVPVRLAPGSEWSAMQTLIL